MTIAIIGGGSGMFVPGLVRRLLELPYVRHMLGGVEWVLGAGSPDPAAADR
jgi:hypothetical protein